MSDKVLDYFANLSNEEFQLRKNDIFFIKHKERIYQKRIRKILTDSDKPVNLTYEQYYNDLIYLVDLLNEFDSQEIFEDLILNEEWSTVILMTKLGYYPFVRILKTLITEENKEILSQIFTQEMKQILEEEQTNSSSNSGSNSDSNSNSNRAESLTENNENNESNELNSEETLYQGLISSLDDERRDEGDNLLPPLPRKERVYDHLVGVDGNTFERLILEPTYNIFLLDPVFENQVYETRAKTFYNEFLRFKPETLSYKNFYKGIRHMYDQIRANTVNGIQTKLNDLIDEYVMNGKVLEVKILSAIDGEISQRAIDIAAIRNHFSIIEWLSFLNPPKFPSVDALNYMCGNENSLPLIKRVAFNSYLKNNKITPDYRGANLAKSKGLTETVQWLATQKIYPTN